MQSILFHRGRSAISLPHTHKHTVFLSLPLAWRGYVARQNLKQIKKEREEAAVRIQSGKEMFVFSSEAFQTFKRRPLEFLTQSCVRLEMHATSSYTLKRRRDKGLKTLRLCETPF